MTHEELVIALSLEDKVETPDWSGLPGWNGYGVPTGTDTSGAPTELLPATLTIVADGESDQKPSQWLWFGFYSDEEPWVRLTYGEAAQIRDALNEELKGYDTLSPEQQAVVNGVG